MEIDKENTKVRNGNNLKRVQSARGLPPTGKETLHKKQRLMSARAGYLPPVNNINR